jgi:nitrogen fixation protein NifQ
LRRELERRVLDAVRQHALEGVLPPAASSVGLGRAEFTALCLEAGVGEVSDVVPANDAARSPFLSPLIALMWSHRTSDHPWTRLMAGTIASAAFGARHLWQDLGASGRPEVSALMNDHFRTLAERNLRSLKWKHHLFLCLGAELGIPDLRPPRCDGCEEQRICFPDGPVVVTLRRQHGAASPQGPSSA